MPIAKGKASAGGPLIGVMLEPTSFIDMKNDFSITGQLDLVIFPLKLCAKITRWMINFKTCCTSGWIKICIPCGFTWGSSDTWDLGCVELGPWTEPHRTPLLPADRKRNAFEKTPPKVGVKVGALEMRTDQTGYREST